MSYYYHGKTCAFETLKGLELAAINVSQGSGEDTIEFVAADGRTFLMCHEQGCCESVTIESIVGDVSDLLGLPILVAEEVTHLDANPEGVKAPAYQDSFTWTFYKLATRKGYVDIRWYGESNGYYSESVDFLETTK